MRLSELSIDIKTIGLYSRHCFTTFLVNLNLSKIVCCESYFLLSSHRKCSKQGLFVFDTQVIKELTAG